MIGVGDDVVTRRNVVGDGGDVVWRRVVVGVCGGVGADAFPGSCHHR